MHFRQLSVHVWVIVEDFKQVAHLQESFLVTHDFTTPERRQNLPNDVPRVGAFCVGLELTDHTIVSAVRVAFIGQFSNLIEQRPAQDLLHLHFADGLAACFVDSIELADQKTFKLLVVLNLGLDGLVVLASIELVFAVPVTDEGV